MIDINQQEYNRFKKYVIIYLIIGLLGAILPPIGLILGIIFGIICLFNYIIPTEEIKYEQNNIRRRMSFKKIIISIILMIFSLIILMLFSLIILFLIGDLLYFIFGIGLIIIMVFMTFSILNCGLIYLFSSYYPKKFGYKYIWARFFIVGTFFGGLAAGLLYAYYRNIYINNLNNEYGDEDN